MRRGTWFRPRWVALGWLLFVIVIMVLGFIPNRTVQFAVSITWMVVFLVGAPATLVALGLWLAGVGAKPVSEEPVSNDPVE
jgi:hypothetical protein